MNSHTNGMLKKLRQLAGVAVLLLATFGVSRVAFAEEVKITYTATPTELTESGTVNLTFEISNYSIYNLSDISIVCGTAIYDVFRDYIISPNGSGQATLTGVPILDSQVGREIIFVFSWYQNGEPFTKEVPVTINRAADPIITLNRTTSSTMAKQGETIMVNYEIKNTTPFDMTDIMVIDEQISDNPIFRNETLQAGMTITFQYPYVMGDAAVASSPVATYTVNGKTKTFSAIDPINLQMILVELLVRVEMGTPTLSGVPFTIEVRNSGNQEVSQIQMMDELGTLVNTSAFSLKPGESSTISYLVVPLAAEPVRHVSFTLTGIDAQGTAYTPNLETIYDVFPYVDDSQIVVTAEAVTVVAWTSENNVIQFQLLITNNSVIELKNVVISESVLGAVWTMDTLPSGVSTIDLSATLGSPRNLAFTVKADDPTGTTRVIASCSLPVAYIESTEEAVTPTPTISNGNNIFGSFAGTISGILIALGVLMIAAVIVLLLLSVMERNKSSLILRDEREEETDLFELDDDTWNKHSKAEEPVNKNIRRHIVRDGHNSFEAPCTFVPVEQEYDDGFPEYDAHHVVARLDDRTEILSRRQAEDDSSDTPVIDIGTTGRIISPNRIEPEREVKPAPKVINTRAQAVVQPKMRSTVKHVHKNDGEGNR